MRQVGVRYERNEYFLAGLIMASEIFLGTVEGDIHDLGKNIANMLLSCHDFVVHDLGVDVPPTVFAEQAAQVQSHLMGLSGLLTTS